MKETKSKKKKDYRNSAQIAYDYFAYAYKNSKDYKKFLDAAERFDKKLSKMTKAEANNFLKKLGCKKYD